jgi:ATP-binding cassette subfamily B protein
MKRFVSHAVVMMAAHPGLFALFWVTTVVQLAYKVGAAFCARVIFDDGIHNGNGRALALALATLVALLATFAIGAIAQERVMARLGTLIGNGLRRRLFEKQLSVSPQFHREHTPSDLVDRMGNDVGSIELALVRGVPAMLLDLTIVAVSIILLFVIEWRLATVVFAAVPLTMLVSKPFQRRASAGFQSAGETNAQVLALTEEAATGYLPLVLFRAQPQFGSRFLGLLARLGQLSWRAHFFIGTAGRSAQVASGVTQVIVIGFGGWLALGDYITAGLLIAFISLLTNTSDAVGRIAAAMPIISRGGDSLGRVDVLLDAPDAMTDPPHARPLPGIANELRFDRVSFAYPGAEPVLREVSFAVRAGSAVALVGASGSGKSTVLSLLTRLYQPSSGSILVDDSPLQDATEDSLRSLITAVPQTPTLFRGTIRDNIAIANPAATDSEIAAAARAAGLAETIAGLPDGYAAEVGDGGNRLSGGQRQRVAIARAFLRGAPILVFDEATSALDSGSEAVVNRSIAALRGRHTVLTVTHRTTGLGDFDEILVFHRGRLAERGRHAELLAARGIFYDLWSRVEGLGPEQEGSGPAITADRLARFDFFTGCSRESIESMTGLFLTERVPEDREVMRQGDPGDKFYILARGTVEVVHQAPGGPPVRLAMLNDGDFFGEVALVADVPRTATIRTLTDCRFLTLHRTQFMALLEREPGLRENVEAAMALRIGGHAAKAASARVADVAAPAPT